MTGLANRLANALAGVLVRRRCTIKVGPGTAVRWWSLNGAGGTVLIGRDAIVNCRIDFDSPAGRVVIGDRCYIGASHLVCHSGIEVGDDVIISWGVTVVDHDSHALYWPQRQHDVTDWARGVKNWAHVTIAPVSVGDKVWIGFGASILKGVRIGEGAVVGAHAVVTRDVPPFSVVAGNPARVVRRMGAVTEREPS